MKTFYFLFVALLFYRPALNAQDVFTKTYGTPPTFDGFEDVLETNGRFYALGSRYVNSSKSHAFYLVVLDINGEVEEEVTLNPEGGQEETGQRILALPDGLLLLGTKRSNQQPSLSDILAFKVDFDGHLLWAAIYGEPGLEESLSDAAVSTDGDILLSGVQTDGQPFAHLWKINEEGALLNEQSLPYIPRDTKQFLQASNDGNWLLAFNDSYNPTMLKLSASLEELWLIDSRSTLELDQIVSIQAMATLDNGHIIWAGDTFEEKVIAVLSDTGSPIAEIPLDFALSNSTIVDVHVTENEHFLIAIRPNSSYATGSLVLEFNQAGAEQNRHEFPNEIALVNSLIPAGAGWLAAGITFGNQGGADGAVARLSEGLTQQWTIAVGTPGTSGVDLGYGLIEGADNSSFYLLGAVASSPGRMSVTLTKVNASGNILWQSLIESPFDEKAYSLVQGPDGHIGILAYRARDVTTEIVLYKVDGMTGEMIWEQSYNPGSYIPPFTGSILALSDGSFIAGTCTYYNQLILIKVSAQGVAQWIKNEVPEADEEIEFMRVYELALTEEEQILALGGAYLPNQRFAAMLFRFDGDDGAQIQTSQMERPNLVSAFSLTTMPDGTIYGLGLEGGDRALFKFSSTGDSLWYSLENSTERFYISAYSLSASPSQHLWVTSNFSGPAGQGALFDGSGNLIWQRDFTAYSFTLLLDGISTSDGGYAALGFAYSYDALYAQVYFIKLGSDGSVNVRTPVRPELNISLFPNPASEEVAFTLDGPITGELNIRVYDGHGRIIRHKKYEKFQDRLTGQLDVSTFPAGTYFFQIKAGKLQWARKLVKR